MEELEQAYRLLPDTVIITDSYWYILDYNRPGPFEGLKKGRNLTRYMPDCRDRPCGVYARHGRVFQRSISNVCVDGIQGGHVVYLAAILPMAKNWIVPVAAGIVFTAVLMKWIFTRITAKKAFKIFGVFYIGAIMIMNCVAISNLLTKPGAFTWIYAIGALLFLISDIVLILNTFGSETKFSLRVTNLSLYYVGQLLIALSLIAMK